MSDPAGSSTGNVFTGVCNSCRPAGVPQRAGALDNGKPLDVTVGAGNVGSVSYTFSDSVVRLFGNNGVCMCVGWHTACVAS